MVDCGVGLEVVAGNPSSQFQRGVFLRLESRRGNLELAAARDVEARQVREIWGAKSFRDAAVEVPAVIDPVCGPEASNRGREIFGEGGDVICIRGVWIYDAGIRAGVVETPARGELEPVRETEDILCVDTEQVVGRIVGNRSSWTLDPEGPIDLVFAEEGVDGVAVIFDSQRQEAEVRVFLGLDEAAEDIVIKALSSQPAVGAYPLLGFIVLVARETEGYAIQQFGRGRRPACLDIGEAATLVEVASEIRADRGSPVAFRVDGRVSSRGVIHFHFLQGKDQLELLRGVEQNLGISIKLVVAGIRERAGVSPCLQVAEIARAESQQHGCVFA